MPAYYGQVCVDTDSRRRVDIVCHRYHDHAGVVCAKVAIRCNAHRVVVFDNTCIQYQVGVIIDLKRVRVASRTYAVYRVLPLKELVLCRDTAYNSSRIIVFNGCIIQYNIPVAQVLSKGVGRSEHV